MTRFLSFFYLILACNLLQAQDIWYVFLDVKYPADSVLIPVNEHRDIRKQKSRLPSVTWYDLPVHPEYIAQVGSTGVSIRYALRWFNAITVAATPEQIMQIQTLPFVQSVGKMFNRWQTDGTCDIALKDKEKMWDTLHYMVRNSLFLDTIRNAAPLAGINDGKGVCIAVLDQGFTGVDKHPAFKHLWQNNQILAVKDFYQKKDHVYYKGTHGTSALSCIAGYYKNIPIGAAPGASFLLARTERPWSENQLEEDHWMAAAEWVDEMGADIISSSLGYTAPLHTLDQLDGKTTLIARAAAIAVRQGIIVIISAGNEGDGKWKMISTPADADSVIAVGATYPFLPVAMNFSSYGPNTRGVMKPDISAPGYVLAADASSYTPIAGTSFSCPLIAGIVACMVQSRPDLSPFQIREKLIKSGHLYPYFDFRHGTGTPDLRSFFLVFDTTKVCTPFSVTGNQDTITYVLERRSPSDHGLYGKYGRPFYYRKLSETGKMLDYKYSFILNDKSRISVAVPGKDGEMVEVWFEGEVTQWLRESGTWKFMTHP